jgi:hypothetical protein
MLFYAAYTWHAGTTIEQVRARHDQQFRAGALRTAGWRGFYELAGGGAGFLLLEVDEPGELTALLQPYMDLMSWDVRAIVANDIAGFIQQVEQRATSASA